MNGDQKSPAYAESHFLRGCFRIFSALENQEGENADFFGLAEILILRS